MDKYKEFMRENLVKENLVKKERVEWIDLLRFLAITFVIIIHSCGAYVTSTKGTEVWWIFNIVNSFSHFSVPIFVMISGALLLKRDEPINIFLKKRFSRILYPFLFWSFVLFLGNILLKRPMSSSSLIISFFKDLFTNNINFTYWYIYMLVGLYLIIPVLTKWIQSASEKELIYFILVWLFAQFIQFLKIDNFAINLTYFSGFIGYLVLGYYLSIKEIKQQKRISIIFILLGSIATIIGNYYFDNMVMEDYLTPNIILLATGIFLLCRNFSFHKDSFIKKIIVRISVYSYGIYLIHIVFISILSRIGINSLFISPYIGVFIVSFITLVSSMIFLELFNKIPYTKYISGI